MWISWSNDNPDRRYFKCYRARVCALLLSIVQFLIDLDVDLNALACI
jgi:hypothetical protein